MKIGLMSDTHSYLDQAIFKHFECCDEIWHAGDIGDLRVAEELEKFKPFKAVFGNIDDKVIQQKYPENLRFECEGKDVWMTHIGGYPGRYSSLVSKEIRENPPKLFICGHSHILKVQYDPKLQLLHLNPGAVGKQGWHKVRTMMRFDLQLGRVENLEIIELSER